MAVFTGSTGNDTLVGGSGNDTITAFDGGDDSLLGGGGTDTVEFAHDRGEYGVDWNAAIRRYIITHTASGDVATVGTTETFSFNGVLFDWQTLVTDNGGGDGLVLNGTTGNDLRIGGIGFDRISGGDGDDTLQGGISNDTLLGGAGLDHLYGEQGNDSLDGGSGLADRAFFSGPIENYDIEWDQSIRAYVILDEVGTDGQDTLRGVDVVEFAGGVVRDWSDLDEEGGEGEGLYLGGTANRDVRDGTLGYDSLSGGDDDDILSGYGANDTLRGGNDNDILDGGEGDDLLDGGTGIDALAGGGGNDTLLGGSGIDVLFGEGGNDSLDGGTSYDLAEFSGAYEDYDIDWDPVTRVYTVTHARGTQADGTDTVRGVELFSFDDPDEVDPDFIIYYDWSDVVPGEGDGLKVVGTVAGDWLTGSAGYDTMTGGDGDDDIHGYDADFLDPLFDVPWMDGADSMSGGSGNDTLRGGGGNDTMDGGLHTDMVVLQDAIDFYGVQWNDTLGAYEITDGGFFDGTDVFRNVELFGFLDPSTPELDDMVVYTLDEMLDYLGVGRHITGTAAGEILFGGDFDDVILGLGGNDNPVGGDGNDTLDGGTGNDSLLGGLGDDSMIGGAGLDEAMYLSSDPVSVDLSITTAQDTGGHGWDTLQTIEHVYSGSGNDSLAGNALANRLFANDGDDTLTGGLGVDTLAGGAGLDQFLFASTPSSTNYDKVLDFTADDDTIALDSSVFAALAPGALAPTAFQAGTSNAAMSPSVRIVFNTTTGALYYDADGQGGAAGVRFAVLDPLGLVGTVTAADFTVL